MPRDGQGVFSRTNGTFSGPTTWAQQAASASNEINSGRHDTHDEDIAQALTGSLPRDGQAAMTGPLPMGGQRIIDLGAPVQNTDGARYGIIPPGRTTTRNLVVQSELEQSFRDVTDPDFGADKTGVADSSPAFQAAIDSVPSGAAVIVKVPGGAYLLNTDVTPNGRIASFQIDPDATFTGTGTLRLFNSSNYGNYGQKNSYATVIRGSDSAPISEPSSLLSVAKYSNAGIDLNQDTAVYFAAFKHSMGLKVRVQSLFCETTDMVGGPGSFVESGRFHTILQPAMEAVSAAIQDDGGVYTDETAAANSATANDMNLLPASPVAGDGYLIGLDATKSQIRFDIGTAGVGAYTITPKYWNGTAFVALTDVKDGTDSFKKAGINHVVYTVPGDWALSTINGQGPFYYLFFELDAGAVTTVPLGTQVWGTETGRSNGLVTFAGASVWAEYMIGLEATVYNNSGIDADPTWSPTENSSCVLASGSAVAGSNKIHSWYATWGQPGDGTTAHVGYLVAPNRTTGAAFRSLAETTYGLDLAKGSQIFAAIAIPNSAPIRARNAANNNEHNVLTYNAQDVLVLGADAVKVQCTVVDSAQNNPLGKTLIYDAADSAIPGFRRLMVPN